MGLYREQVIPRIVNIACSTVTVQRTGRDARSLPHRDDGFDASLSTWTLCTIPTRDSSFTEPDVFYQRGAPKFAGAVSLGVGLAA
jgi:hypothetical protein